LTIATWPALSTAEESISPVPCTDPRGCPDLTGDASLMYPQTSVETFDKSDCGVQEGSITPGTHRLVRFGFVTLNQGPGALIIGNPTQHPEWFAWHKCHHHFHFREYADYRLWEPDGYRLWDAARTANPGMTAKETLAAFPLFNDYFVAGNKLGFCVIDIRFYPQTPGADDQTYVICNNQGLAVGWADVYSNGQDGQWIDITGLQSGQYVLEQEVNAERLFTESDYADNRVARTINI
jgi:hypothetical protein